MQNVCTQESTVSLNSDILAAWNGGMTVNTIRREMSVTWYTIRKTLDAYKAQGIFVRDVPQQQKFDWSGDKLESLSRMFKEGSSYAQLAKHFGCSIGVISGTITRNKITRPSEINVRNIQWAKRSPEKERELADRRDHARAQRSEAKRLREERDAERKRLRDPSEGGVEGHPIPPTKSRYVATAEELAAAKTLADMRSFSKDGPNECRFPLNDPAEGEAATMLFCGKETTRGSYCQWHAHVCTSAEQPTVRDLVRSVRRFAA